MESRAKNIPGKPNNLKQEAYKNFILSRRIDIIDALNLGLIFFFFLSPELNLILQTTARFVLFPLAAIMANVANAYAWRMALMDTDQQGKLKTEQLFWASLRLIGAVGITLAVFAGFSGIPAATPIPGLVFIFNLGLNALVNKEAFVYFWGRSNASISKTEQDAFFGRANDHFLGMTGLLVSAIAVTTTMVLGITACAPLGLLGSAILIYGSVKSHHAAVRSWKDPNTHQEIPPSQTSEHEPTLSSSHRRVAPALRIISDTKAKEAAEPSSIIDVAMAAATAAATAAAPTADHGGSRMRGRRRP